MKYLLLPLLLLFVNKSYTQSYVPLVQENKFWIYEEYDCIPRKPLGAKVRYFEQDIIIDNKVYKSFIEGALEIDPIRCVAVYPYNIISKRTLAYMREDMDERKLYMHHLTNNIFIPCEDTTEILLFDFGLSAGNTIPWCTYNQLWPDYDSVLVIIDSISPGLFRVFDVETQEFYFKSTKVFYLFGVPLDQCGMPFSQQASIIEGYISNNGPNWGTRTSVLQRYCEGTLEECNIKISSVEDTRNEQSTIVIYPNPAYDILNITAPYEVSRLEVLDQNGRVLLYSSSIDINVSSLSQGMYFIKCYTFNNTYYIKKFVKM